MLGNNWIASFDLVELPNSTIFSGVGPAKVEAKRGRAVQYKIDETGFPQNVQQFRSGLWFGLGKTWIASLFW